MRKISVFLAISSAFVISALAQKKPPAQIAELLKLEQKVGEAVIKQDVAFLDRVWSDEFTYGGVRGEFKTKAEVLAEIKSGTLKFEMLRFEDVKVRLYGNSAVVTGQAITKGRGPLGEISGQYRYTRVWVKQQGAWRLVAFQGTPITQS